MTDATQRDVWVTASDGTRIYADDRGPVDGKIVPLLCLPGLTRNCRDFEPVQERYADQRRIISVDFRGRGKSSFADPATYRPDIELADTLALLDHLGVGQVALLGTSRGGIVGMLMAATARSRLAGLCLNDVGTELEARGLLRIAGYVGTPVQFATWAEAASRVAAASHGFAGVSPDAWQRAAKRMFLERNGSIVQNHDLALALSLPSPEDISAGKIPNLWALADFLADMPCALLRGSNSDLLSSETASEMIRRIPTLSCTEIPDRGHVPFLDEPESVAAIDDWLYAIDRVSGGA